MKRLALFLGIILLLTGFAGCAKKSASDGIRARYAPSNTGSEAKYKSESDNSSSANVVLTTGQEVPALQNQKIIISGQVNIETLKFDDSIGNLKKYVNEIGGYIQSSNVSGYGYNYEKKPMRNAEFVFRIPKNKYQDAFNNMQKFGKVRSEQTSGEDVTESYFDTEARVKMLKIQEERILELLKKSGKLQDILELEKELMNIRYEIENLTGTLRKWDNLVEYSTLSVYVHEVEEVIEGAPGKAEGLFTTLLYTLKASLRDLWKIVKGILIILVYLIPFLVPFGIILFLVLKFLKKDKVINAPEVNTVEPPKEDKKEE